MTESRIEKLTRIGQEMAAAVDEMRDEAVDLTPDLTTKLAIWQIEGEAAWWRSVGHDRSASRTFESMTGDSQQAVRTGVERVLAHLQSAGRLIPAGGMALTAEQVEDVRRLLDELASERDECDTWDLYDRLRALFPAAEPAEEPCTGNLRCEAPLHAEGCYATHRIPPGRLAPAEPAEEETKAEDESGWHWVQSAGGYYSGPACTGGYGCRSMAHYEGCLRPSLTASSPVVPAPTETEFERGVRAGINEYRLYFLDENNEGAIYQEVPVAELDRAAESAFALAVALDNANRVNAPAPTETEWATWQEVPEGVKYYGVGDTYPDKPVVYVNRPSVVRHRVEDGMRSSTPDYEVESFAPFVAAEER